MDERVYMHKVINSFGLGRLQVGLGKHGFLSAKLFQNDEKCIYLVKSVHSRKTYRINIYGDKFEIYIV